MLNTTKIKEAWNEAREKWPTIDWSLESYRGHVEYAQAAQTNDAPLNLVDLYLAGAAAHRLSSAWSVIERELAPQVSAALRAHRRASAELSEDIWCDTRTRLMEPVDGHGVLLSGMRPARMVYYRGGTRLYTYILKTAMNRLSDRRRREKVRQAWSTDNQFGYEDRTAESPISWNAERESHRPFREALLNGLRMLTSRQARILGMMCGDQSVSQKDIAATLGTSPATICREIKRTEGILREAVTDRLTIDDFPRTAKDILGKCITEHLVNRFDQTLAIT